MDKKFDYNQLIGFVLLTVLLGGFFYINRPDPNEIQKNQTTTISETTDSVENAESLEIAQSDSLTPVVTNAQKEQTFVLENEKLKVSIGTIGAQLKEVQLLEEYAYDKKNKSHKHPLFLIKNNASQNIQIGTNGKIFSTLGMPFEGEKTQKGVKLTSNIEGGRIVVEYSLTEDYKLAYTVKTEGITLTNKDNKVPYSFDLKAFALEKGRQQEKYYNSSLFRFKEGNDVDSGPLFGDDWEEEEALDWVAFKQQFFSSVLQNKNGFVNSSMTLDEIPDEEEQFIKNFDFDAYMLAENGSLNQQMEWSFVPMKLNLLKSMGNSFKEIIPFGWSFIGWLNEYVFYNIFKLFSEMGINFGIVILLMTIVIKLLLSPVQYKQFKQSAVMKLLKPDIDVINEKYKDKKNQAAKKQQEIMALYSKAGANPLAGCLPALLQVPIFYSLFRFFPNIFELRGKPFLWADDLTAYDSVFEWTTNIPLISSFYGNHVSAFALLYMVLLLVYTKMTASNLTQQTQEGMPDMRVLMYIMPIMFVFFLNSYAAGLSWYYVISNFINIGLILVIKNYLIDEDKLHAKVQANKAKPKKEGRIQRKMRELMDQAEQQKKNKK